MAFSKNSCDFVSSVQSSYIGPVVLTPYENIIFSTENIAIINHAVRGKVYQETGQVIGLMARTMIIPKMLATYHEHYRIKTLVDLPWSARVKRYNSLVITSMAAELSSDVVQRIYYLETMDKNQIAPRPGYDRDTTGAELDNSQQLMLHWTPDE